MSYLITLRTEEPPEDLCVDCPYQYFISDGENFGRRGCYLKAWKDELIPEEQDPEEPWDGCPVTGVLNFKGASTRGGIVNAGEIIDTQSTIISMQAKVINDLFAALNQYMTVEELDGMTATHTINDIAKLRDGIDREM
jgi:hypothetical protein